MGEATADTVTAGESIIAGKAPIPLTDEDRKVLENVDRAYADALALKEWWDDVSSRDAFRNRFQLIKEFDQPDWSFGYLDEAPVGPVMGEIQDLFYDRTKEPATAAAQEQGAEWMNEQIREFVLKYFLRNTSSRLTEAYPETGNPAPGLGWVSQCPEDRNERKDIGFYQQFYREKDSGTIGRFSESASTRFVDVREIGSRYDWVVAKARLLDFQLTLYPLGRNLPPLTVVDHKEHLWVLFTPYFNTDDEKPEEGVLGEYGMGFAIIQPPASGDLVTIGPQVFHYGFNYFKFRVHDNGMVRARVVFCCNQLDGIFPLPVSPVDWTMQLAHLATFGLSSRLLGPLQERIERIPLSKVTVDPVFSSIDFLNLLTGDALAKDYCISKEQIFKFILSKHATVFHQMVGDSVRVWRQIPDWLDTAALPRWVVEGEKPPA
ncbi:MAG: hypothetical protein GY719_36365 [bacterium]|nr:hypothetical protein [bacterium]